MIFKLHSNSSAPCQAALVYLLAVLCVSSGEAQRKELKRSWMISQISGEDIETIYWLKNQLAKTYAKKGLILSNLSSQEPVLKIIVASGMWILIVFVFI